jgi:putative ABC transport system permease protein
MGATWASVSRDFLVPPSELIRPRTPPAGKRILLERIGPLWDRVSFLYKVSFRNVFRDKKRFLMMVAGVSGCTALLIAGYGIGTSVADVADHQFDEILLFDYRVIFSSDMSGSMQRDFAGYMADKTDWCDTGCGIA